MKATPQAIRDVLVLTPDVHGDSRGFFVETARARELRALGIPELVQQNQSRSQCGVLRGLHYQQPYAQGKLVRCSAGRIFDVAVDLRPASTTRGRWVSALLDDVSHQQLWVPPGFAHGFLVLSDMADVCYSCSDYYCPEAEHGIAWNDPDLAIAWPELPLWVEFQLSARDRSYGRLRDQSPERLPA
jgi:dTDP-4-dehydrorhamnose 3,5-epimerase